MPERRFRGGPLAEAATGMSVTEVVGLHPMFPIPEHSHPCSSLHTHRELGVLARSTPRPGSHYSAQRGRRHQRWRQRHPSTATSVVWVSGTQQGVRCAELPQSGLWFCGCGCFSGRGGLRFAVVVSCQPLAPLSSRRVDGVRAP